MGGKKGDSGTEDGGRNKEELVKRVVVIENSPPKTLTSTFHQVSVTLYLSN